MERGRRKKKGGGKGGGNEKERKYVTRTSLMTFPCMLSVLLLDELVTEASALSWAFNSSNFREKRPIEAALEPAP